MVGNHGNLDAEERGRDGGAEQVLVTLVVGVCNEGDTRGEEFGAGRLDVDVGAVRSVEGQAVVRGRHLFVFEFGLSDGGAERDVPECGGVGLVGLAAVEVTQERALCGGLRLVTDGAVRLGPVDAEAEGAPDVFELLLVLDGQALTQLDEVAARDRQLVCGLAAGVVAALERRDKRGVVGERRVDANAVVVLHPALGGQAVVVPAHRVEDRFALHTLVARDEVHVRVAEHVTDVQASRGRRRRGVHGEDVLAGGALTVETVGALVLPRFPPLRLKPFEGGFVGHRRGKRGHGSPDHMCGTESVGGVPECGKCVHGTATVLRPTERADEGLGELADEGDALVGEFSCSVVERDGVDLGLE